MSNLPVIVLCLLPSLGFAQKGTLKGCIYDPSGNVSLLNTTIYLARQSDTVLEAFTRADSTGKFLFNIRPGKYVLVVTKHLYADFIDTVDINTTDTIGIPRIILTPKTQLLAAVTVKADISIRRKGDTVEYRADSFYMPPGATVEELLKNLPGLQVDRNGKITVAGDTIKKVLVDGEEIFGTDPTKLTKNFKSLAVDKVQVYDKKSDQAILSGIDDGQRTKVINLKIKPGFRRGFFGNLALGTNAKQYSNGTLNINALRPKSNITILGTYTNSGLKSDDLQEAAKVTNFPAILQAETNYTSNNPTSKIETYAHYDLTDQRTHSGSSTTGQYLLPDTFYYLNQSRSSIERNVDHHLKQSSKLTLDSTSFLRFGVEATISVGQNQTWYQTASSNRFGTIINKGIHKNDENSNNKNIAWDLAYYKRFSKKGRLLSIRGWQGYKNQNSQNLQKDDNVFYDSIILINRQYTDFKFLNHGKDNSQQYQITYSDIISKKSSLEFHFQVSSDINFLERRTYSKPDSFSNHYNSLVDSLSSRFSYKMFTPMAGLVYQFATQGWYSVRIGADWQQQGNERSDEILKRKTSMSYNNLSQFLMFTRDLGDGSRLSLVYQGQAKPPSINQLQPLKDITDPLNVILGNPGLKQTYSRNISLDFTNYQVLTRRTSYLSLIALSPVNEISNSVTIDSSGKRVVQPINVQGNYTLTARFGFARKLGKKLPTISFDGSINHVVENSVLNFKNNQSRNFTGTASITVSFRKPQVYDIYWISSFRQDIASSSLQVGNSIRYWIQENNIDFKITLPHHFDAHMLSNIAFRPKTSLSEAKSNTFSLNFQLVKFVDVKGNLKVTMSGINLLNQNLGIQQNINANYNSEVRTTNPGRYFIMSIIYSFKT